MTIQRLPDTVQQALGEDVARDFVGWLEGVLTEGTIGRAEWASAETRWGIVEHDLAEVKAEVRSLRQEMNERFDRVGERFDRQSAEFNARFDRQSADFSMRFDELYRQMVLQTRWTVGTIALFGTIVTMLLAVRQLAP